MGVAGLLLRPLARSPKWGVGRKYKNRYNHLLESVSVAILSYTQCIDTEIGRAVCSMLFIDETAMSKILETTDYQIFVLTTYFHCFDLVSQDGAGRALPFARAGIDEKPALTG